ncbi:cytochrome ubiquinol oxidase subunit I [Natronosporangium hydrolyticum]|uniref:Cytochrome ubiquinol oxidase subunit I n=1 Tax=Natronosporangium hydrolyticum TaxID=2811111 RepID=A0A895YKM4_9ACTN|nr:cytochrome ubiquinol oxidase subunit I [Natronosporangium hydrolyticum]QSB16049.1 cytochrome ubiquinol oxidase subunit I [Natronosporangium hydrolyticum]
MDALELARWQFGVTTVYHFLFVPLTIGLVFLVAGLQTAWHRTGNEKWLRLTKLFGKLFLINFAMGVVTGIVQEFQFGMNWSSYSRFVGDVFGAPLAIEALLAFFLESTFIGLWLFGWDRLPRRVHLACIWAAAVGTALSAYFILAANSWMQNPVGFRINEQAGRAELTDIGAVLTNPVALVTYPHVLAGCFLVSGAVLVAVALWHLIRRPAADTDPAWRSALRLGAITAAVASVVLVVSGDIQAKVMTETQPMKMAAAEALFETESPASFSLFTVGTLDGSEEVFSLRVPGLLSWLATGDPHGEVEGVTDIQVSYEEMFGPGSYAPNLPVTYWSFRLMIGLGALTVLISLWALWAQRRGRTPTSRWLLRAGLVLPLLPLAANSFGWILREMGRQPWVVFGEMRTADGVSPAVSVGEVATSFAAFTLLYGVLAVIEVKLLLKYAKQGLPEVSPPPEPDSEDDQDRALDFAY